MTHGLERRRDGTLVEVLLRSGHQRDVAEDVGSLGSRHGGASLPHGSDSPNAYSDRRWVEVQGRLFSRGQRPARKEPDDPGPDRRPLPSRSCRGARRHGHGVALQRRGPRPGGRGQADRHPPRRVRARRGPRPSGGALLGRAEPPQRGLDLRHRRRRQRPCLAGDGVRALAHARRDHPRRGPSRPAARGVHRRPGRRRPRGSPCRRDHPPGREARQHPRRRERRREDHRLRHRPPGRGRPADPDRPGHRDALLLLPRAGTRRRPRSGVRRVRPRRGPVPRGRGTPAVPRAAQRDRDAAEDRRRGSACAVERRPADGPDRADDGPRPADPLVDGRHRGRAAPGGRARRRRRRAHRRARAHQLVRRRSRRAGAGPVRVPGPRARHLPTTPGNPRPPPTRRTASAVGWRPGWSRLQCCCWSSSVSGSWR